MATFLAKFMVYDFFAGQTLAQPRTKQKLINNEFSKLNSDDMPATSEHMLCAHKIQILLHAIHSKHTLTANTVCQAMVVSIHAERIALNRMNTAPYYIVLYILYNQTDREENILRCARLRAIHLCNAFMHMERNI